MIVQSPQIEASLWILLSQSACEERRHSTYTYFDAFVSHSVHKVKTIYPKEVSASFQSPFVHPFYHSVILKYRTSSRHVEINECHPASTGIELNLFHYSIKASIETSSSQNTLQDFVIESFHQT
jgi:hypothetical protein